MAAWPGACITGFYDKMDFWKPSAYVLNIIARTQGMRPGRGAKPLVYACLAPESELEGMCGIKWIFTIQRSTRMIARFPTHIQHTSNAVQELAVVYVCRTTLFI